MIVVTAINVWSFLLLSCRLHYCHHGAPGQAYATHTTCPPYPASRLLNKSIVKLAVKAGTQSSLSRNSATAAPSCCCV